LFINLTPFIPLSFLLEKERGKEKKEGRQPLLDAPTVREAKPLLLKYFPLPLIREGGQGDRITM
jgi:hypothetical protein